MTLVKTNLLTFNTRVENLKRDVKGISLLPLSRKYAKKAEISAQGLAETLLRPKKEGSSP